MIIFGLPILLDTTLAESLSAPPQTMGTHAGARRGVHMDTNLRKPAAGGPDLSMTSRPCDQIAPASNLWLSAMLTPEHSALRHIYSSKRGYCNSLRLCQGRMIMSMAKVRALDDEITITVSLT